MTDQPLPYAVLHEVDAKIARRFPAAHDPASVLDLTEAQYDEIQKASRAEAKLARTVVDVVQPLGQAAMGAGTHQYLVLALAVEHRTILAQIGKAVAEAILETVDQTAVSYCPGVEGGRDILHRRHDGRFTCDTVIGALLMSNQPLI